MFERLVLEYSNSENYLDIFLVSLFFALLSIFLVDNLVTFQVGRTDLGGIIAVLLTSLSVSYPFVTYMIRQEDRELLQRWEEKKLVRRHARQLELYMSFFFGVTFAFALSVFYLPDSFYSVQLQVLQSIRGPTGNMVLNGLLMQIVSNNMWVFAVTFVLAFFVSSGIIFILAWNASVLGVLIGSLADHALQVPFVTLFYLPHGLLEVGGYVLAGIAGSLMSYAVERPVQGKEKDLHLRVLKDVAVMVGVGAVLIVAAGLIEVI
ncbi:MAG: stage II sporulation protein M [Candidatus Nanohaloarchaea archaeon]